MRYWVLPLCLCLLAFQAQGAIWQVERDGSGDFTVIQDCVDASASGDTILVGSGRYNEWQMYGGSTQYPARVIISDKDLTIIGESDGSSVIGPAVYWEPGTTHQGIVLITDSSVTVRNITLENLFGGIMSWVEGGLVAYGCTFQENFHGIYLQGGNSLLEDCILTSSLGGGNFIFSNYQDGIVIRNCTVDQFDNVSYPNQGIIVQGCPNSLIENCVISGTRTGIQIDFNTTAEISHTRIANNPGGPALSIGPGGCSVHMFDCSIENSQTGVNSIEAGTNLMVESTTFNEVERSALLVNNLDQGFIRDCILARGERGVVLYYPHLQSKDRDVSLVNDFDMRGNFWGTDNPDSIQAWIEDISDDPAINYRILWEPYNGGPVPSETSTLGSVKSLFR